MTERDTSRSKFGKAYPMSEIKALEKEYQAELAAMVKQEGNKKCADCFKKPSSWASVGFGTFICVDCAQLHRSGLGKVKNLGVTYLWHPDEMEVMRRLGNEKSNAIFLKRNPNPDLSNMQRHIDEKYVKQLWK